MELISIPSSYICFATYHLRVCVHFIVDVFAEKTNMTSVLNTVSQTKNSDAKIQIVVTVLRILLRLSLLISNND